MGFVSKYLNDQVLSPAVALTARHLGWNALASITDSFGKFGRNFCVLASGASLDSISQDIRTIEAHFLKISRLTIDVLTSDYTTPATDISLSNPQSLVLGAAPLSPETGAIVLASPLKTEGTSPQAPSYEAAFKQTVFEAKKTAQAVARLGFFTYLSYAGMSTLVPLALAARVALPKMYEVYSAPKKEKENMEFVEDILKPFAHTLGEEVIWGSIQNFAKFNLIQSIFDLHLEAGEFLGQRLDDYLPQCGRVFGTAGGIAARVISPYVIMSPAIVDWANSIGKFTKDISNRVLHPTAEMATQELKTEGQSYLQTAVNGAKIAGQVLLGLGLAVCTPKAMGVCLGVAGISNTHKLLAWAMGEKSPAPAIRVETATPAVAVAPALPAPEEKHLAIEYVRPRNNYVTPDESDWNLEDTYMVEDVTEQEDIEEIEEIVFYPGDSMLEPTTSGTGEDEASNLN